MPFEFIEDIAIADVAFRAWGGSAEEVFAVSAAATLRVMVQDLAAIVPRVERAVRLEGADLELLLFDFLQEFLYYKDAEGLLLLPSRVAISPGFRLEASLWGEVLDPQRHELLVDVKAVTMHLFSLTNNTQGWKAQVVLDI
ncbi:MAG: archease [Candidatus Latescibacteria bacterium]|nr:archease [Candidatus Latescibacterota bacterium]